MGTERWKKREGGEGRRVEFHSRKKKHEGGIGEREGGKEGEEDRI